MWASVVPQQPPTKRAPARAYAAAYSAKYAGPAGYSTRPVDTCSGQPALGLTHSTASGTASRMARSTRSSWAGPPEQFAPMTSAPHSCRARATWAGVSPNKVRSSRVKVTLTTTGRSGLTSRAASRASRASCKSVMVSMTNTSTPAAFSAWICSRKAARASWGCTRPKGARGTPSGPTSPATSTARPLSATAWRARATAARLMASTRSSSPCSARR